MRHFLACVLAAVAVPAAAQEQGPVLGAVRIERSEAPAIDGDLSDPAWAKAAVVDGLTQFDPQAGQPGTERSVVRVMHDEDNLYISFMNYDSDPAAIVGRIMVRDGGFSSDDFIRIYLDPNRTRRDGYIFEVNPTGARQDALTQNNATYITEWNAIWHAHGRRTDEGWTAEVAIPFKSISYSADSTDWGFDLYRMIRRKGERLRWAKLDPNIQITDISRAGTLTGMSGMEQGAGLDIQLYGTGRWKREWIAPREDDLTFEPSGNLFYKITPSLTGTLTFNTDFSNTPLDDRRVNTSRFPLFFPETRDFFLQDAAVFEFGGGALNDDVNGRPFFSRNIGLVFGSQVDIVAGAKLSGEAGGVGLGVLTVQTEGTATTDGKLLSVARATVPVLAQSELGLILTNGDPTDASENTVAGVDFQFRDETLIPGKTVQADLYYARSFSDVSGEDDTFGVQLNFPNEPFGANFRFKQVGADYDPRLGFVARSAIRGYNGNFRYFTRYDNDSAFRWTEFGTFYDFVTNLSDRLESRENGVWFGFSAPSQDIFFVNAVNAYEDVTTPFNLPRGVVVPAGKYDWTNVSTNVETAQSRWFFVDWELECCSFLDGDYFRNNLYVEVRPNQYLSVGTSYGYRDIDLPTGDVQIQIAALNVNVNITPDMQVRTQAQWDDVSKKLGLSVRYRWEFAPGSELFAALGESADWSEDRYASTTSQASLRIGHTLRF